LIMGVQGGLPRSARNTGDDGIHVMIVDDSAVVRGLIARMLEAEEGIRIVASVGNGELALSSLSRHDIDVIILDIEMPVMDGLTALPKLLEVDPGVKIIMASSLTARNADISLRALESGAADYIPKPSSSREFAGGNDFRRELLEKVKSLAAARRGEARPPRKVGRAAIPVRAPLSKPAAAPIVLRKPGMVKPDIIAIGSSTGGPQALFSLFRALSPDIGLPIIITQHMPPTFTTILAEHISRMCGWTCVEAKGGEVISAGNAYLAPGDFHLLVETKGPQRVLKVNQDPPENFCRPSVDPMLRSVVSVYGNRVLTVILTGMGLDGLKGGQAVVEAGGTVIAQDEKTSVVWGMPGAVATAGICSRVLPIDQLAPSITQIVGRGR
jgi:two-component system, chemotaxis family, protein-glutamate methylesterase/glutaminase